MLFVLPSPPCLGLIDPLGVESLLVSESYWTKHSLMTRLALGDSQFLVA